MDFEKEVNAKAAEITAAKIRESEIMVNFPEEYFEKQFVPIDRIAALAVKAVQKYKTDEQRMLALYESCLREDPINNGQRFQVYMEEIAFPEVYKAVLAAASESIEPARKAVTADTEAVRRVREAAAALMQERGPSVNGKGAAQVQGQVPPGRGLSNAF